MASPDWFPSTSEWKGWSVPAFPVALTTAVQTVGSITQAVTTVLGLVKTSLEALSAVQLARADLTQLAINASVTAIDLALKSLEGSTGVYLLLAPPRRRVIIPTAVQAAMDAVGLPGIPAGRVDPRALNLQTLALKQGLDPTATAFLQRSLSATGGSAGFLRTVLESLTDTGDLSRPQLADTDAVAGGLLLSGAPDYATLLSFLLAMDSLVGPGRPASALNAPDWPTPQDLKVLKSAAGAQLSWKPQVAFVTMPALGTSIFISEIAVIRSTDASLMWARSPTDLFGTTNLTEGLKQGNAEVIKIRTTAAGLSTYLDETIPLENTPVYYALSFRYTGLDDVDKGFGPLSNAVKLVYGTARAGARSGNSVPPDWVRMPRAIDLIPAMAKVFDKIRSAGTTFSGASLGADTSLKAYVTFLEQLVAQYSGYMTTATTAVAQITALSSTDFTAGAGLYGFAGVGGNGYLVKAITEGVSQLTFSETDFVGGAVIVVAGPSPAVVAPVWSIIELLLGTGGAEDNIFTTALAGLNEQLVAIQALEVGDDFKPGVSSAAVESTIPSDGCVPFTPDVPTIKDDFTV